MSAVLAPVAGTGWGWGLGIGYASTVQPLVAPCWWLFQFLTAVPGVILYKGKQRWVDPHKSTKTAIEF